MKTRSRSAERGKILFRVLSDEESRKVTRWQAPEIAPGSAVVANTRQQAKPGHAPDGEDVHPLLGSKSLKAVKHQAPGAPPRLQTIKDHDVFADSAVADLHHTPADKESGEHESVLHTPVVSADMLQTSYDEGYAFGYAEGNAALQQQSVKELKQIVAAIADASSHPDEADLEQAVVSLSLEIARLVIRREIQIDDTLMLDIVQAGLEQLPGGSRNQQHIKLHPLDANVARQYVSDNPDIHIIDDLALERGACRIESGASVVHAGINDWLKIVAVQLGLEAEQDMLIDAESAQPDTTEKPEHMPYDE